MKSQEKLDLYQSTINELRLFEGEMLKQIKDFYRVGLTWTSNALEGNSLTESETKVLIGCQGCQASNLPNLLTY